MAHMWNKRNACKVLVGSPEDKRPCGTPKLRQEERLTNLSVRSPRQLDFLQ